MVKCKITVCAKNIYSNFTFRTRENYHKIDLRIHEINCEMDMGQDSIYQLACINFTLFLALEKSDHSTCSSGELSWKKISQIFLGND